jgi:hypothetical protein
MSTTTKIDFKREFADLYLPGREPRFVEIPEMGFLMIDGEGDPNSAASYREAIETLFAVAYTAKFMVKRGPSATEFAVMPLESLWWAPDGSVFGIDDASEWRWTAMIMQPEPVTAEIVQEAGRAAGAKRSLPALERLRYERFAEGRAAQLMYLGAYKDEGPTIRALHAFIAQAGYSAAGRHHEIYLGDPRRTAPERLRTVLRQPVARL